MDRMKARVRNILQAAIETGIETGYAKAFKHTDDPTVVRIKTSIDNAIWNNIYEVFTFDEQDYDE
jgi:hypothetical protein